jgi:hypothetical protein
MLGRQHPTPDGVKSAFHEGLVPVNTVLQRPARTRSGSAGPTAKRDPGPEYPRHAVRSNRPEGESRRAGIARRFNAWEPPRPSLVSALKGRMDPQRSIGPRPETR